jgi:preprotein translocase subunit SecD
LNAPRLLIAVALAACACASRQARYRNLELRLVGETGGQAFPRWAESGTTALEPEILFSGKDFASIETSRGGDDKKTPSLALHFTKEAADRFTRVTTRYTGRRLAVVVDGKVVTAPKILHPITTGLFEITGPSEADVREMYGRIKDG